MRPAGYLDRYAFRTTVESSANAPREALDSDNVIAIGTWGTLTPLKPYLERMDFELGPHEDFVRIKNPRPGEPEPCWSGLGADQQAAARDRRKEFLNGSQLTFGPG